MYRHDLQQLRLRIQNGPASPMMEVAQDLYSEVLRLRKALWECYTVSGADTDGDDSPDAIVGDIVPLCVGAVQELRDDYNEALHEYVAVGYAVYDPDQNQVEIAFSHPDMAHDHINEVLSSEDIPDGAESWVVRRCYVSKGL